MRTLQLIGYSVAGFGLFKGIHELLRINPKFAGLAVTSQIVAVGAIMLALTLANLYPKELMSHFKINPNLLTLYVILTLVSMLLGVACAWIG